MSTSIITTTTFTFAIGIDVQAPSVASASPIVATPTTSPPARFAEDEEIPLCLIVAHPRCAWTARKRCSHRDSHKS